MFYLIILSVFSICAIIVLNEFVDEFILKGGVLYMKPFDFEKKEELLSKGNVVLFFGSEGCPSCKLLKDELAKVNIQDEIDLYYVDIVNKEGRELAVSHRIMSIPVLILFKDGKEVNKIIGYKRKQHLEEAFSKLVSL